MRSGNEKTVGQAIKELIKAYGLEPKLLQVRLEDKWPEIVGELIAKHTREIQVHQYRLVIKLDNAPLRQELNYQKEQIIDLVNQALESKVIRELEIR
jgi:predicted nucleic acid-binding Zn ribbon protein